MLGHHVPQNGWPVPNLRSARVGGAESVARSGPRGKRHPRLDRDTDVLLTGKARLAGVMGWPVTHSRSPRLHGHWFERYGIDGAYVPLPVRPGDVELAFHALPRMGF